jgi:importin-5
MQITSTIGAFLKKFGDAVLPQVEALMQQHFNPLLTEPGRSSDDRWVALMIISDCIEFAPASAKYLPSVVPQLLHFATSSSHELVNVCVYTMGVIAEKYPAVRHLSICN